MKKFNIKNIDIRKFLGTIIGGMIFICCVLFLTYAYYNWKSPNTNVTLAIQDLSVECLVGAEVEATNIGPILNYQDGVKSEFSIANSTDKSMAIELYLDITTISENLLTESFKYALVADSTGGTNYDYSNPILEGNFTNFTTGNNLITQDLEVTAETTTNYQFIIYIDGNMYNKPNMQQNSLIGTILIGNCGEDAIPLNSLVYQAIYSETDNSLTFVHTKQLTVGDTYNNKTITALYTGFDTANYTSESKVPWYSNRQNITTVNFDSIIKPKSTAYWFYEFSNITELDLSKLNTNNVTSMENMFTKCSNLISLDVSSFNTTNVTNMKSMFSYCSSLTELDLSNFNTSNVTVMNVAGWHNNGGMFTDCSSLTELDVSSFDTSKLTSFGRMFKKCSSLTSLDVSSFVTSQATDMGQIFSDCSSLTELDLSNFVTTNVTGMNGMFSGCNGLKNLNISHFITSSATSMDAMFYNCSSLTELNVSNFNTSQVTDMASMFYSCSNLTELDLSNFVTSNVTSINYMFQNCSSLTELDVSNFNTSSVVYMNWTFGGCSSLTELDVSNFNTVNVIEMKATFSSCRNLTSLNVSNWNTSQVTTMYQMFDACNNITELNVSNWNVSKVTNMFQMFYGCKNLTYLDTSNWNTESVTNMGYLFASCYKLTATITIRNTGTTNYRMMLNSAATAKDSEGNHIGKITINYVPDNPTTEVNESTESLVDAMIATGGGNIEKGCYGTNCPVVGETT